MDEKVLDLQVDSLITKLEGLINAETKEGSISELGLGYLASLNLIQETFGIKTNNSETNVAIDIEHILRRNAEIDNIIESKNKEINRLLNSEEGRNMDQEERRNRINAIFETVLLLEKCYFDVE